MGALDDPRVHESERLALEAERAWARGEREHAQQLFARAAHLEAQVALSVGAEEPRLRSVLAISAVALGLKAALYEQAEAWAHRFLASPEQLTPQGRHFMLGFRELAPDGESVGQISFSSPTWRFHARSSVFKPEHRRALAQGLVQNLGLGAATRVIGRLKAVNLRGKKPFIQVETDDKELVTLRIEKGAFDDTIGPKLNHRVVILSEVKQGRYGASELFAADVSLEVPVEDGSPGTPG